MDYQGMPPPDQVPGIPVTLLPLVEGMLREETRTAAEISGMPIWLCPLDPGDQEAYGRLLEEAWGRYEQLLILEHDIVPPDGRLAEMAVCPRTLCSTAYPIMGNLHYYGLGCVRYGRDVQAMHPMLMWHAAANYMGRRTRTHWQHLDGAIARELQVRHIPVHTHAPPAVHLHDYGEHPNG